MTWHFYRKKNVGIGQGETRQDEEKEEFLLFSEIKNKQNGSETYYEVLKLPFRSMNCCDCCLLISSEGECGDVSK